MDSFSPAVTTALDAVRFRPLHKPTLDPAQARKTGEEFEAMFLGQMLEPMFDALPTGGFFGGGMGERLFRSLQVNEYAKAITRAGGIGLADAVAREIITLQEKANG